MLLCLVLVCVCYLFLSFVFCCCNCFCCCVCVCLWLLCFVFVLVIVFVFVFVTLFACCLFVAPPRRRLSDWTSPATAPLPASDLFVVSLFLCSCVFVVLLLSLCFRVFLCCVCLPYIWMNL